MVRDDIAQDRLDQLIEAVRRGSRGRNLTLLGTSHEVLVEKAAKAR